MITERALTIPGRYDRVSDACQFVSEGAQLAGFDTDEIFRIELACDEACTNVIQHAYRGENRGDIRVSWQIKEREFVIVIRDKGQGFDPDSVPQPDIPEGPEDLEELKIGGLGLHFMRTLMDQVHFSSDQVEGNKLVMIKYRSESTVP